MRNRAVKNVVLQTGEPAYRFRWSPQARAPFGPTWISFSFSVQCSSISLLAHELILWTSVDRKCFFNVSRLSSSWKPCTTFVQPEDGSVVGRKPGTEVHVASATVAMGWICATRGLPAFASRPAAKGVCGKCGGFILKENGDGTAPELGKFSSTTLSCEKFFPGAKPNS